MNKGKTLLLLCMLFLILWTGCQQTATPDAPVATEPRGADNLAYRWGKVALQATANDTERFRPRPTVTSRMLALVFTSIFDAWTRYDAKAEPLYLKGVERRPAGERTLRNKETAISHAAFHALNAYFLTDSALYLSFMQEIGMNPADTSTNPATAVGIGNLAARHVIAARRNDGSNQYGDMGGAAGIAYGDYTGYHPVNSVDKSVDNNRWQPKYFSDGKGGKFAPGCLTPHWGKVRPLLLDSAAQFRPPPPPLYGSDQLKAEVEEVVKMNANLSLEEKALVEFMRDGPKSVQQTGHWLMFAQNVSLRDSHTLDQDVKLYFLVTAAAMDGFIACWEAKMHYDFARPFALVHAYFKDQEISAWGGPSKGTVKMRGQDWMPYSPETFVCPPFPSYVSGHSTVSGACSEALRYFTGSDSFGLKIKLLPGALTEPGITADTVTLDFPTFTSTADQAGISRVLGGYHIQSDNVEGLNLGRNVGRVVYEKYKRLVGE